MFLSNPFPGAFGLDVGDLSIKLVQLARRHLLGRPGYFKLKELRTIAMPPGAIVNGEILQPEIVRKKLMRLLGGGGGLPPIRSRWVVANLPEPKTFLKLIQIDTPPKELIGEDVIAQARKHLPFELEETYLDWQIINTGNTGVQSKGAEILLAAVPKVVADSYTYLLEAAGLNPVALEVEALSLARAMITDSKQYLGEARAILDIGATRGGLSVYDNNTVQFTTTLNFSGDIITTALAQGLKIERAAAEKLKVAYGLAYCKEQPKYLKIVTDIIEQLIAEIKRALTFYQEHFADTNPVTHITMSGGLANMVNLDATLSRKLRIGAHPGNAWKNVSPQEITEEHKNSGLALASAIGLALRAARNPLHHS